MGYACQIFGNEWCSSWMHLGRKLCQVSERRHTQHIYFKKLWENLGNVSSILIQRRRYQSSQSQQRKVEERRGSSDGCPGLAQDSCLLPYQRCIIVTKHNWEDELIQFFYFLQWREQASVDGGLDLLNVFFYCLCATNGVAYGCISLLEVTFYYHVISYY